MEFFTWLQDTPLAHWVASDPSLLAYPTILTLHTVGMAIVVGTCVVMDLRLLGVGGDGVPLRALQGAPKLVWTGFFINAATGLALFTTDAEHKATQTVFFVKLALIFLALAVYGRIRKLVFRNPAALAAPITSEVKALAIMSLMLWTGATVAGRLMAYLL
jgi:hypothetical protein